MPITIAQCRGGRGMLNWSQLDLCKAAKVSKKTLADFEMGYREPYARTLRDLQEAMERAGVVFLEDGGVRLQDQAKRGGPGGNAPSKARPKAKQKPAPSKPTGRPRRAAAYETGPQAMLAFGA